MAWRLPGGADRLPARPDGERLHAGVPAAARRLRAAHAGRARRRAPGAHLHRCSPSCSDVGGYFAGIFIGRHPMAPASARRRPGRASAGSVVACLAAGAIMLPLLLHGARLAGPDPGRGRGRRGDPRRPGRVHDQARPGDQGHGLGICPGTAACMDRIDSLLFVAPVTWLLLAVFVPHGRPTGPLAHDPAAALRREVRDQAGRPALRGQHALRVADRDDPQPPDRPRRRTRSRTGRARRARAGCRACRAAAPPRCRRRAGTWPARGTTARSDRRPARSPRATGTGQATGRSGPHRCSASWSRSASSIRAPPVREVAHLLDDRHPLAAHPDGGQHRVRPLPGREAARTPRPAAACRRPRPSTVPPGPSLPSRWPSTACWKSAQASWSARHRQKSSACADPRAEALHRVVERPAERGLPDHVPAVSGHPLGHVGPAGKDRQQAAVLEDHDAVALLEPQRPQRVGLEHRPAVRVLGVRRGHHRGRAPRSAGPGRWSRAPGRGWRSRWPRSAAVAECR